MFCYFLITEVGKTTPFRKNAPKSLPLEGKVAAIGGRMRWNKPPCVKRPGCEADGGIIMKCGIRNLKCFEQSLRPFGAPPFHKGGNF